MDESLLNKCNMSEFVGTAPCDTIGLVIARIDESLRISMNIPEQYSAVGLIGSRTAAGAQILAADDAVKATGTHVVSVELPRDTKGWGGHGCFIILGADTVSDARRAVEIALERTRRNTGEVYISEAGHMEFQFGASSGEVIEKVFGIERGKPFGFVCASPAPIGLVIADIAMKAADIHCTRTLRPSDGTSHSNEVIITFTGETNAVLTSVREARTAGMSLLRAMGSEAPSVTQPYI